MEKFEDFLDAGGVVEPNDAMPESYRNADYEDTKKIFSYIEKKIVKGGIIVFDDFGIWGVDGIKKFIYEIEKIYRNKFYFIKNYMGQCILIKK